MRFFWHAAVTEAKHHYSFLIFFLEIFLSLCVGSSLLPLGCFCLFFSHSLISIVTSFSIFLNSLSLFFVFIDAAVDRDCCIKIALSFIMLFFYLPCGTITIIISVIIIIICHFFPSFSLSCHVTFSYAVDSLDFNDIFF